MDYYKKLRKSVMKVSYLNSLLGRPCADEYNILLAHNPDYFQAYAGWGADLVLSGHVHGGIMRLPVLGGVLSPALRLFPRYDGGLYEEGKSKMVLGRGLGTHTLPIRVFNPGELIVVRLEPEEELMAIEVKLQVFESPLDLLLHLIEKNKVDIYDIPIAEITEQYMEYIRQMEEGI